MGPGKIRKRRKKIRKGERKGEERNGTEIKNLFIALW